jgi:hypothetical protein
MQREDLPWDFNWSSIGLNWIDRNIKAKKIYDLYQQVLSNYMLELTKRLSSLSAPTYILKFYEQLFKKFTSEILYLILYKFNDRSKTRLFRREKIFTENQKQEIIVSIFYEIFTSLLTNCLNCDNELVSIHISGSDLICSHCGERYEVKSTKSKQSKTFFTGAPRGIYDLIHGQLTSPQDPTSPRDRPGHLLVIVKNSIGLFQVMDILDSQIQVTGTDVVSKEEVEMSLDQFSVAKLAMFPSRSFREYSTKLTVRDDQFVPIVLRDVTIRRLTELQSHLHFEEIGRILIDFQRDFVCAVQREELVTLVMEDEYQELCPTVTLINQKNMIDPAMLLQEMVKLQDTCEQEISRRQGASDSSASSWRQQPPVDAHTSSWRPQQREDSHTSSWRPQQREDAHTSSWRQQPPVDDHTSSWRQQPPVDAHTSSWRPQPHVDARTSSFDTLQPNRGASASSAPIVKEGTLIRYDPRFKRGQYEFDGKKINLEFDLNINQSEIVVNKRVKGSFSRNGNLNSVSLLQGGNKNYDNEEMYKIKYLKYKNKYIQLKLNI